MVRRCCRDSEVPQLTTQNLTIERLRRSRFSRLLLPATLQRTREVPWMVLLNVMLPKRRRSWQKRRLFKEGLLKIELIHLLLHLLERISFNLPSLHKLEHIFIFNILIFLSIVNYCSPGSFNPNFQKFCRFYFAPFLQNLFKNNIWESIIIITKFT